MTDQSETHASASKNQIDKLRAQISERARWLEGTAAFNENLAFRLKISLACIAFVTTVCLGLGGKQLVPETVDRALQMTAIISSAVLTIVSVWDAFYPRREVAAIYFDSAAKLRIIEQRLEFLEADIAKFQQKALDELQKMFEKINADLATHVRGKTSAKSGSAG